MRNQWEFQDPTDGGTLVPYVWPYFMGMFPYIGLIYIGLILMVGTSNQSDPENPIDIMLTSGEAYLDGGLSLSILVNGGYNHSYYHH